MNESEVCRTCGHFVGTEKHQCDACRTEFRLRDQLAAATKRADDAERELDAALAVLREVEWKGYTVDGGPERECPSCSQLEHHAPSCALASVLKGGAE